MNSTLNHLLMRSIYCATLLSASLAQAQTATPASAAPLPDSPSAALKQEAPRPGETEAQRKHREREEAEREVKAEEKQRVGGVMPLFNVVISGQAVPLSPRQKFELSYHTIIDPYTIGLAIIGGGIGEIQDDHTGYSHGPAGFFKRAAASYADNVIGNVVGNAALPVLLHQDPRYYRLGKGSLHKRIIYSALTTFICYGDNGKKQFNTSNVLGNFVAGAISNVYYPADERGFGLTLSNATYVTLEGMLGGQILEFSPDVADFLHRRSERKREQKRLALLPTPALAKP